MTKYTIDQENLMAVINFLMTYPMKEVENYVNFLRRLEKLEEPKDNKKKK